MHWKVKGLVQKFLSLSPAGVRVNDGLQRTVGGLRNFDANVDMKVREDWLVFMSHLRDLHIDPGGLDCLEVGTGWYPTLPFCFSLAGVRRIHTFDLNRYLKPTWTSRMIRRLQRHLGAIAESSNRTLAEVTADYRRLTAARSVEEMLALGRIEYLAPADAAATGLPAESIDIVYSNSVFEHVPAAAIEAILRENLRVLRKGGVVIHSANCGDHYAYTDARITPINYLTYSSEQWEFWQNRLLYQNRLRPRDFRDLALVSGFEVARYCFKPRDRLLRVLDTLPIAPEFQKYPPEQLCSTSVDLVLRHPRHETGGMVHSGGATTKSTSSVYTRDGV
jgi:SAM-dependent methyltransferase